MTWHFPRKSDDQMGGNSLVSEFFGGTQRVREVDFVRESIQNSIDARLDENEPVAVHFRLGRLDASAARILGDRYLTSDLRDHALDTPRFNRTPSAQRWAGTSEYLVYEDLNTTGLEGQVDGKKKAEDEDVSDALTTFFRLNGVSGKSGDKLGSFGVGRHVFYSASRISTFFVHTTPIESHRIASLNPGTPPTLEAIDSHPMLFGMSLQEERSTYDAEGRTEIFDNYLLFGSDDPSGLSRVVLPYGVGGCDSSTVTEFHTIFECERPENVSGTSIVVLQPQKGLEASKIRKAVVNEFAIPILRDELIVKVDGKLIDSTKIRDIASSIDPRLAGYVDFLDESTRSVAPDTVCALGIIAESSRIDAPGFDARLDKTARAFRKGAMVTVRVTLDFFDTEQGQGREHRNPGEFHVHLQLPPDGSKGRRTIARSSLVIRGGRYTDGQFRRDYNGLVAINTSNPLGALLRHAEGPAHDEWKASRIDDRCDTAATLIRIVQTAADSIHAILLRAGVKADRSIFADLLPSPGSSTPPAPTPGPGPGPNPSPVPPGPGPTPDPTPPTPHPKPDLPPNDVFQFDTVDKGGKEWFRIRPSARKPRDAGTSEVRIEFAYDTRVGSPFSRWTRDDFDFKSIGTTGFSASTGTMLMVENGQTLCLELGEDPSRSWEALVPVDLFDQQRDVRIRGQYRKSTS